MADFVEYDLGNTEEENEPESDDMFDDEPPSKKPRGANLKYDYVEEAESFNDLKEKVKNQAFLNAGITSLPTSKQVNNYVNIKKHCHHLNFDDIEKICKHVPLIQVICYDRQWPNMPALCQTINGTAINRRGRPRGHTQALLH